MKTLVASLSNVNLLSALNASGDAFSFANFSKVELGRFRERSEFSERRERRERVRI